jgi:hypothetical protein
MLSILKTRLTNRQTEKQTDGYKSFLFDYFLCSEKKIVVYKVKIHLLETLTRI